MSRNKIRGIKTIFWCHFEFQRLIISLAENKFIAWTDPIKDTLYCGTSTTKELETTIGRLGHLDTIVPFVYHFLSRLQDLQWQTTRCRTIKISQPCVDDLHTMLFFLEEAHKGICWVRCRHCSDYKAWGASGNYEARGASGDYEAQGASGGKYEARMVIFCILAAVNRFFSDFSERGKPMRKIGKPLKKIEKPLKKAESRWRKRKAIEENWILCEENRILGEGKSQYFPRDSLGSGDFGYSFPTCDW